MQYSSYRRISIHTPSFWIAGYATPEQEGLIRCRFSPEKGFETEAAFTGLTNPSYVLEHHDLPVLYTVEEKEEGAGAGLSAAMQIIRRQDNARG